MKALIESLPWLFWITAILFSLFFGIYACKIFLKEEDWQGKPFAWFFFQFWLNFVGSFVGWSVLWKFLPNWIELGQTKFSIVDFIALIFIFIGITGHIPALIIGLVYNIRELLLKLGSLAKITKNIQTKNNNGC
jgi:hypothetical protein